MDTLLGGAVALSSIHTPTMAVSDFTAAVIVQVMMIGFLVTLLLGSGFLLLNIGLLSKRKNDLLGGRTPSDVGMLRDSMWPEDPEPRSVLPADEDEDGGENLERDEAA